MEQCKEATPGSTGDLANAATNTMNQFGVRAAIGSGSVVAFFLERPPNWRNSRSVYMFHSAGTLASTEGELCDQCAAGLR